MLLLRLDLLAIKSFTPEWAKVIGKFGINERNDAGKFIKSDAVRLKGLTQNVKDLLSSREVENIFENSDYVFMLNQASGDSTLRLR